MKAMPKPELMAEGGKVGSGKNRWDYEKGVNKTADEGDYKDREWARRSESGSKINQKTPWPRDSEKRENAGFESEAKGMQERTLGQSVMLKNKDRSGIGMAEGGEVDEGDDELHDMLGEELMDAFHSKDKKRAMSAIEACVMRCMNKGDE
jgi:hypothetical protein